MISRSETIDPNIHIFSQKMSKFYFFGFAKKFSPMVGPVHLMNEPVSKISCRICNRASSLWGIVLKNL